MSADFQPGMEPTGNRSLLYYVRHTLDYMMLILPIGDILHRKAKRNLRA